ncbi:autotransporter outer membrane beta-barrel domain-containing protein [Ochrobactrum sp. RH2CCR150]|uniref:autotransporter outer membrane beta-barrel domain-containing protein n=1 Tax=Ochrobactrum sp. RH2CCR150 TaxID=2587044 RepID=UPI0015FB62F4|nr:fibronectin-binding autotransporter adhesin [Ochrobactrum sp. RH2CCR150]
MAINSGAHVVPLLRKINLKSTNITLYSVVCLPLFLLFGAFCAIPATSAFAQTVGGRGGSPDSYDHDHAGQGGDFGQDGTNATMPVNQQTMGMGGGGGGACGGRGGLGVAGDSTQGMRGGDGGDGGANCQHLSVMTNGSAETNQQITGDPGSRGQDGTDADTPTKPAGSGGGGGAGGYGLIVDAAGTLNTKGAITGGNGGDGGNGGHSLNNTGSNDGDPGAAGNGGGGGVGVWINHDALTIVNSSTLAGGIGGGGGVSQNDPALWRMGYRSGSGGDGGAGVSSLTAGNHAQTGSAVENEAGATISGGAGGVGGDTPTGPGSTGKYALDDDGANGGAGGAGIYGISRLDNKGTITGGVGGRAGTGSQWAGPNDVPVTNDADGGAGGVGVFVLPVADGSTSSISNSNVISGGVGGAGGNTHHFGLTATNLSMGGHGGAGISATNATIENLGTIIGGAGGAGGIASSTQPNNGGGGDGGDGIYGTNVTIVNSGIIMPGQGGAAGSGSVGQAGRAIYMVGNSVLEIHKGSDIRGKVLADAYSPYGPYVGDDSFFILGGSQDSDFDGSLSKTLDSHSDYQGFQTFQKSGSSTWTLGNSYNVDWQIRGGTLQIGDRGVLDDASTIDTGTNAEAGVLAYKQATGVVTVFGGEITGWGRLRQAGKGTLVLTNNRNEYMGGTEFYDGVISVSNTHQLGAEDVVTNLYFNGGTLQVTGTQVTDLADKNISWGVKGGGFDVADLSHRLTLDQQWTGGGALTKDGAGTLALTGLDASFTGDVVINKGRLLIGAGGATGDLGAGSSVTIANGASLVLDRTGDDLIIGQTISGDGQLVQQGVGKTVLTGDNLYTGNTEILTGTLQIGQNGATGSLAPQSLVNIDNSAKLVISRNDTSLDLANLITGDGQVVIDGDGTVNLSNPGNTYGGGTELDRGTLKISADDVLGSGSLTMNGGTLLPDSAVILNRDVQVLGTNSTFNTSANLTLTGRLTGLTTTAFWKEGAGRLILDQSADASGFVGAANVNEGVMLVNSAFGGSVNVKSGGTLAGSGTVGDTNVAAGGKLEGMAGTTLTINGGLIVDAGGSVQVDIGATPNLMAMFNVTGDLTLDGTLDVTNGGNASPGIYRIFNYDPSQTNSYGGFQLATVDGVTANLNDWKIEDTTAGQINLVNMKGMTFVVWDGQNQADGVGVHGGDGHWNAADKNWKDLESESLNNKWADGSVAVFKATAGTVTIDDQANGVNSGGLVFDTDDYHIAGGPLNMVQGTGGTTPFIEVGEGSDPSVTATIDTVLQGSSGLTKTGVGTLILTKDATYSGTTMVTAGTLQLGNGGHEGAVNTDVELNGSQLADTALVFKRSDEFHFQHSISGNGEVIQRGTGTTTFNASNSFSGGLTVESGTVKAGIVEAAFGSGRVAVEKGATLDLDGFNQTIGGLDGNKDDKGDGEIQLGSGTVTLNQGFSTNFSGKISGKGGLVKNETGTLTLSGTNDYSGVTAINGGSLVQGAKDAFSSTSAYTVANGATLDLGGFATGMKSLENGGTVDFGGTGGTTLNVAGDYVGGGTLVMSTVLGADNSTTDLMTVGGNTSGTTSVVVKNRGGLGAATVNGIELIDIAGNSGGTFNLQGDYTTKDGQQAILTSSAYAYTLQKGDVSGTHTNDWYLVSQYTISDPDGPNPPDCNDPNGCSNNPDGPSRFSPAAPVYTSYAASMQALNQLPTLQQRRGDRYLNKSGSLRGSSEAGETDDRAIWARIEGAHNRLEPNTTAGPVQQDINTVIMQAGVDGQFYEDESGRLIAGITGQYGNGHARTSSEFDDANGGGELNTQGWGLGGTVTWYGNDGFYVDGQAQATWYKTDLRFGGGNNGLTNDNNGFGYAFSVETGKRFTIDKNWSLTPQAQLMFSSVDFDTFSDNYGATVSNRDGNSLNGRLGLAANYANSWQGADSRMVNANVYGIANLYQEFLGGTSINYGGTRMKADQDRTWAGVGFGGTYAWADNKYSVYGEGTVNTSLSHFADSYAVKGNVGFKVNW